MKKIEICLGSSCYSKGSNEIIKILKEYVSNNSNVELIGGLCKDKCSDSPVVIVDGILYENVSEYDVLDILKKHKS